MHFSGIRMQSVERRRLCRDAGFPGVSHGLTTQHLQYIDGPYTQVAFRAQFLLERSVRRGESPLISNMAFVVGVNNGPDRLHVPAAGSWNRYDFRRQNIDDWDPKGRVYRVYAVAASRLKQKSCGSPEGHCSGRQVRFNKRRMKHRILSHLQVSSRAEMQAR